MKKLLTVLAVAFVLTACSSGVDQAAYDAVVKENAELKEQIEALESQMPEENGEDDEIGKMSRGYAFEATRDVYWIEKQVGFFNTMLDGTSVDVSDSLNTLIDSVKSGYDTHMNNIAYATANGTMEELKEHHDNWVKTIDQMCDALDGVYVSIRNIIKATE